MEEGPHGHHLPVGPEGQADAGAALGLRAVGQARLQAHHLAPPCGAVPHPAGREPAQLGAAPAPPHDPGPRGLGEPPHLGQEPFRGLRRLAAPQGGPQGLEAGLAQAGEDGVEGGGEEGAEVAQGLEDRPVVRLGVAGGEVEDADEAVGELQGEADVGPVPQGLDPLPEVAGVLLQGVGEKGLAPQGHDPRVALAQGEPGPFQEGLPVGAVVSGEEEVPSLRVGEEELRRLHGEGLPEGPEEVLDSLGEGLRVPEQVLGEVGGFPQEVGPLGPLGVELHQKPFPLPVGLAPEPAPVHHEGRAGAVGAPLQLPERRAPGAKRPAEGVLSLDQVGAGHARGAKPQGGFGLYLPHEALTVKADPRQGFHPPSA
ncbi:hypothetical protein TthHB5018_b22230 (plasmid) [Thermus thermophilus]|uniref:Uncharacterized protein n=1 Tax=Thermus thermophilus TaxID=274 RepID=A0A7R7TFT0_THETH|nr:hypothetical protein TthHB5018_b22230 [Thermus thermophilus]